MLGMCSYTSVPDFSHDAYRFWYITTPVMVVVLGMFLWADAERTIHALHKRTLGRRLDMVSSFVDS